MILEELKSKLNPIQLPPSGRLATLVNGPISVTNQTTIMDKTLGTLSHFWVVFQSTQVQPLPSPHKRCWMRVSRIFSEFQLCIEWGRENCKKISKRMHCFKREPLNNRKIWILLYCPKDKTVKWKYLVWDVPKSTFYSRLDFTSTRLSWSLALNGYWISFPFLLKDFVSSRRIFLISGSCSSAASALDLLIPSVESATCFENYSNNAFNIFSQRSRDKIDQQPGCW